MTICPNITVKRINGVYTVGASRAGYSVSASGNSLEDARDSVRDSVIYADMPRDKARLEILRHALFCFLGSAVFRDA